jgi:hypothetical protein
LAHNAKGRGNKRRAPFATLQRTTATVEIGPTESPIISLARLSLPGVQTLRILKVDRANLAADLPTGEVARNEVNPTVTA